MNDKETVAVDDTLDGLASCLLDARTKNRALQDFIARLMVEAEESIGACECEPCKRLRRTGRGLLAAECPNCEAGVRRELVCCRRYRETGECCSEPVPEWIPCETCDGMGFL